MPCHARLLGGALFICLVCMGTQLKPRYPSSERPVETLISARIIGNTMQPRAVTVDHVKLWQPVVITASVLPHIGKLHAIRRPYWGRCIKSERRNSLKRECGNVDYT